MSDLNADLIERFCDYVKVNTQADEQSSTTPSTPGQLDLGRLLSEQLREIGAHDVVHADSGLVTATLPATMEGRSATLAWLAHMDTALEASAKGVKPNVVRRYDGGDIPLKGLNGVALSPRDYPNLKDYEGKTLITTDGTTLLGGDDKAGIAVIMEAAKQLLADPSIPHGTIRICFSCDEEIGRGTDHIDLSALGADVAYTLDGEGTGEINDETFSADLGVVTIKGVSIHPSVGKGKLVSAIKIASELIALLPADASPETTEARQGFFHPYVMSGGVEDASVRILLRDFDTERLLERGRALTDLVSELGRRHPRSKLSVEISKQYRNMADGLAKEPRAVSFAEEAMRRVGIAQPRRVLVRGGTDGSWLTEKGLPCPNLSCGQHNPHSIYEWVCVEEMAQSRDVLVELAQVWAREGK